MFEEQECVVLTLSRLRGRLGGVLSLAIHISPNNGPINTVSSAKPISHVLPIHCALLIMMTGPLLVTIWYHYYRGGLLGCP